VNIGDLFRIQIKNRTTLGIKVQEIIPKGGLVTDDLVFDLLKDTIKPEVKGIIFDGFPRTIAQAKYLMKHYNLLRVFYLDLSEKTAIIRISSRRVCQNCHENFNLVTQPPLTMNLCDKCGGSLVIRNDDSPETIHVRFSEYNNQTRPLKKYFEAQGILSVIQAEKSIQEIFAQIKTLIAV